MVGAAVAGGIIGAEREFRASPAGFRTHILVALSSALLMLGAVHQVQWLTDTPLDIIRIDPVRMAHGVLTGIGFLCGGVIFREGVTVRGLTTAASLWTTSALGVLFGVGFYPLAVGATLATVVLLAAVNLTDRLIPQKKLAELTVRYRRSLDDGYPSVMAILETHQIRALDINESLQAEVYQIAATISWKEAGLERGLAASLQKDPDVIGFELVRRN
ncbi:MgtC/SapB family protein [bacterium]|nr:MAG: MgtC/SapB family protein [bacterium]